jgi:glycosyltransferase involved in cell wall biosynthesis
MNQDVISPLLMKYGRYVYARANRILAVSTYLKNNLIDKFDVEVDVVPNIVDLSSFKRNEQRENSENYQKDSKECDGNRENLTEGKTFSIVSVGALNSNKRMDLLIESFYAAFNGAPGFKLYIYGDGKERDRLQDLIDRLKLEHNVFLMGVGHRTEIANKMRESDCFALFSKLETFGVSFIEALSLGLPVISTKSGGPEDFISNENGIIVNDESIASLAGAIVQMHNDIEKYDKTKVSRSVEERFGPQVISSRLLEIYLNVLEEKMQRKPETND